MPEDQHEVSQTLQKVYEMIKDDDVEDQEFALQQAELEKAMALRASNPSTSHSAATPGSPQANRRISALFGSVNSANSGTVAQRSSRADDVQFAAEVSENLLLECRRQQIQIKQLEQDKGSVSAELELLRQKLSQAEQKIDASSSQQEQLREANWSLELQLQETQALLSKQGDAATKWTSEASKLKTAESSHLDTIDQLTSAKAELTEAARAAAAKHDADAQTLRKLVEELEDDLAMEKTRVATLESTLKRQSVMNAPVLGVPRPVERGPEVSEDSLTTPTNSPPVSPIKATPRGSTALENDTQRAALSHVQRQLQTLRTALQREKTEKLELKRQLLDMEKSSGPNRKKKQPRSVNRPSSRPLAYPKRPSTAVSTEDEDGDDEFDFESAAESLYETADSAIAGVAHVGLGVPSHGESTTDFFSVNEHLETSTDSGEETPTGETPSEIPRSSSFFRRIFTKSPSSKANTSVASEDASMNDTITNMAPLSREVMSPEELSEALTDDDLATIATKRGFELVKSDRVLPVGFVAVSSDEYSELTSRPAVKGDDVVVLSKEEHQALVSPDLELLKAHAESANHVLLPLDSHRALVDPSFESIKQQADKHSHVLVSKDEHAGLVKPAFETIQQHADSHNHVLVAKDEHAALVNPAFETLQQHADKHNHVMVSKDEHGALVEPAFEKIQQLADKHNHVLVSKDEHAGLVKPAFETIQQHADSHNHVLVAKDEHASLVNPAFETIQQHADKHNHVLVSKDEHGALLKPAFETIQQHADSHNHVLVSKDDHAALLKPNVEKLREHANSHNHVLLSTEDHESLRRPSLDTIRAQLDVHNHVMVPREEHDSLIDPTIEKVAEFAVAKHHVVVPEDEYDRLKSPSFLSVSEEAKKHNHVLVGIDEYDTLTDPDVTSLQSHARKLEHILLSEEEYQALKTPSIDSVADHAKAHHHVLLSQDEYDALCNPGLDQVKERAGHFQHIAIPNEQYQRLLNPDLENVKRHAMSLQHVTVSNEEFQKLQHPSREELPALASAIGMSVLGDDELAKLRREAHNPTEAELVSHAAELELAVLPTQELEQLRSPSADKVREAAAHHELVVLTNSEHEELVSPSREMVEKHLEREKPSLEVVRGLAKHHNRVLVVDDDDGARSLAAQRGLVVLTSESLEELQNPPLARALQSLKRLGYAGLPLEEFETLKQRVESPSIEEVKARAQTLGLAIAQPAEIEELAKLRHTLSVPSELDVEEMAAKLNFVALPRDVYERMEETTKNPDEATIVRYAQQRGLEALPASELEAIKARASHPSREDVDAWARDNDYVTLPSEEYEKLVRKAESQRKQTDLANLSVAERRQHFESLIKDSRGTPTKSTSSPQKGERMTETLKSLGYVPLPQEEYRRLLASQTVYEPTKGDIIRGARTFGMTAVPTDEYRALLDRSGGRPVSRDDAAVVQGPETPRTPQRRVRAEGDESLLATPAEDEGFKAVPVEYLETLRRIAEAPSREDVDAMAKKLGLELYSPEDVVVRGEPEQIKAAAVAVGMIEPENLKEKALEAGLVEPLSDEQIKERALAAGLIEPTEEEIRERALTAGFIEPEQVKELALSAGLIEPLGEAEIKNQAKSLGLVEPLTIDEIKDQAKAAGLVEPLTEGEIRAKATATGLVDPSDVAAIKQHAFAIGLVEPLSQDEIKRQAKAAGLVEPTEDVIKERASAFGMTLPLDIIAIKQQAKSAGLVEPMSDAEIVERAKAVGLVEPMSQEQLLARARAAGLSEPLTVEQIKARARAVGLVDPVSDAEVLARAKRQGWTPPLSNQELLALVRRRGLSTPSTPTVSSEATVTPSPPTPTAATFSSHRRTDSAQSIDELGLPTHMGATRQLPVSRRFEIVRSPSVATASRPSSRNPPPRSATTPTLAHRGSREQLASNGVESDGVRDAFNRGFSQGSSTVSRSSSHRSLHSNLAAQRKNSLTQSLTSGMSVAELDHPTTMSFVTQLVIGELLYKYVAGFSLHSLTGGRHERYFWVHPYSLTLYWDKENPAVGAHRRYTGPKSAAILDITEVTDRNPLPAGLYYKSLIVTTTGKSVKITCPTRRRHLVWYRGIKYLLEKARDEERMTERDETDTPEPARI